ncbi:MAG: DUF167 domain-containing protein [Candidatus Acidiferrales bacterium]
MIEISERGGCVTFAVRLTPRASRDAVEGELAGAMKVRVTAPPVEDRANDALRTLLAARLGVAISAVEIVAGAKSRTKRVAVSGVTKDAIAALVSAEAGRK